MNCRSAQDLILAARDTAPGAADAAALAEHVATCPECQTLQARLAEAVASWRDSDATVATPDPLQEWHAVRRRLRGAGRPAESTTRRGWGFGLAFGSALAIAVALWVGRTPSSSHEDLPGGASMAAVSAPAGEDWAAHFAYTPRAEFVETTNEDASPFIYLDEESEWLVVWVSDPPAERVSI